MIFPTCILHILYILTSTDYKYIESHRPGEKHIGILGIKKPDSLTPMGRCVCRGATQIFILIQITACTGSAYFYFSLQLKGKFRNGYYGLPATPLSEKYLTYLLSPVIAFI